MEQLFSGVIANDAKLAFLDDLSVYEARRTEYVCVGV